MKAQRYVMGTGVDVTILVNECSPLGAQFLEKHKDDIRLAITQSTTDLDDKLRRLLSAKEKSA